MCFYLFVWKIFFFFNSTGMITNKTSIEGNFYSLCFLSGHYPLFHFVVITENYFVEQGEDRAGGRDKKAILSACEIHRVLLSQASSGLGGFCISPWIPWVWKSWCLHWIFVQFSQLVSLGPPCPPPPAFQFFLFMTSGAILLQQNLIMSSSVGKAVTNSSGRHTSQWSRKSPPRVDFWVHRVLLVWSELGQVIEHLCAWVSFSVTWGYY